MQTSVAEQSDRAFVDALKSELIEARKEVERLQKRDDERKGIIDAALCQRIDALCQQVFASDYRYKSLQVAVQDLLCELRIDEKCLELMSNGYSPDYPGAMDLSEGDKWDNPYCKIQISQVVAQKLWSTIRGEK